MMANDFKSTQKTAFTEEKLISMSTSTLEEVFVFLMRTLFGGTYSLEGQKWEMQVMFWADKLKYPYASDLKPNVLKAPGVPGSTALAVVIGFLDWLREEVEAYTKLLNLPEGEGLHTVFFQQPDEAAESALDIDMIFHNVRLVH